MILSALMKRGVLRELATAIPATGATEARQKLGTVAGVAAVAVATPSVHAVDLKNNQLEINEGDRTKLRALGFSESIKSGKSAAEPRAALLDVRGRQDDDRTLAPGERAELVALVDLIADHHAFTLGQRAEAQQIAQADAVAALECFRSLEARDGSTTHRKDIP